MKKIFLIFLFLFSFPFMAMGEEQSTVRSYDDYMKIKFFPSRMAFMKKEAVRELQATSSTIQVKADGKIMGTNNFIKNMHSDLKAFVDKEISVQVPFHENYWELEVSYMGDVVKTSYSGSFEDEENSAYLSEWLPLYQSAYKYMTQNIEL